MKDSKDEIEKHPVEDFDDYCVLASRFERPSSHVTFFFEIPFFLVPVLFRLETDRRHWMVIQFRRMMQESLGWKGKESIFVWTMR